MVCFIIVGILKSLDLSPFDTHKYTDFRIMFEEYSQELTVIADINKAPIVNFSILIYLIQIPI